MPQQYYTLDQAAQILRINPEQLKEMARKKEIRAFQDRSGWRFRSQEIDEMARERGLGSDPELPLGDAVKAKSKPGDSGHGEVFNFRVDEDDSDEVQLGKDPAGSGHASRSGSGSGVRKTSSPKSPPPKKAGSDSDVRLVLEGSDVNFAVDSGGKAPASKGPISPPPKAPISPPPKPGSSKSRKAPLVAEDSARIVPLDRPSDSDVKIEPSQHDSDIGSVGKKRITKKASDSDIRIEEVGPGGKGDQMVTEEIDLDAEQRKADTAGSKPGRPRHKPGSSPALPTVSPFELSENDIKVKGPVAPKKDKGATDSSSDFDLQPMSDAPSSPLESDSDEVGLGELSGSKGKTGINLGDPADSGISLVPESSAELKLTPKGGESSPDSSSDFDLNVSGDDSSPTTGGSSSDFELSLQDDDASPTEGSSSEFELSLDPEGSDLAVEEGSSDLADAAHGSDSDSEFELTLDDSGGLSSEHPAGAESDENVFETDFAVPSLNEDSGSGAVALDESDTDLETSDFDLSVEGEESGSQVVPLEEESDEAAATVQRKAPRAAAAEAEGMEDLGEELDEDLNEAPEEEEAATAAAPVAEAPPAEWGAVWGVILPVTTSVILFLVMLMGFELIQGMWSYHTGNGVSSKLVRAIATTLTDEKLPDN